jgi:hypothetical protein
MQIQQSYMRYIPGLGVPLIVTGMGILAKKLAGRDDWKRDHFYLGSELTLAALATGLLNFYDLCKPGKVQEDFQRLVGLNATAILMCFILLMFVLSLHQDWEPRVKERPKLSFFWLICVSNMIGFGLLAAVVILIPVS